MTRIRPIKL